jgi:WD repeat-containing protein 35
VYLDGTVIIGGVDGSRYWGKELDTQLYRMAWSPDSKILIFGTVEGELLIYDYQGNFSKKITVPFLNEDNNRLATIEWSDKGKMYTQDTPISTNFNQV